MDSFGSRQRGVTSMRVLGFALGSPVENTIVARATV
jgi:hypothetical protein